MPNPLLSPIAFQIFLFSLVVYLTGFSVYVLCVYGGLNTFSILLHSLAVTIQTSFCLTWLAETYRTFRMRRKLRSRWDNDGF